MKTENIKKLLQIICLIVVPVIVAGQSGSVSSISIVDTNGFTNEISELATVASTQQSTLVSQLPLTINIIDVVRTIAITDSDNDAETLAFNKNKII